MLQRNKIFSGSLFRILVSLCMAVILFFITPLYVSAEGVLGDLTISLSNTNLKADLFFFGNYAKDGTDRDSEVPYIFSGDFTVAGSFEKNNNYPLARFANGYASVILRFQKNTQTTGLQSGNMPTVTIQHSELPDGVNCSILPFVHGVDSFAYALIFNFDNYRMKGIGERFSLTMNMKVSAYGKASLFGSSYSYIGYSAPAPVDSPGQLQFSSSINDVDPLASMIHSDLFGISDKISSQTAADRTNTEWLAQQIYSDFALQNGKLKEFSQNEIDNANANHRDLLDNLLSIETRVTNRLNVNSTNEINTANKNADDIMNSYDSTSQGSDNERFDDSQKELQETEDNLFGSATGYFDAVDFTSAAASLVTIASSLSFVSGLMQQLYIKSGVFGMIVTISLVVMIASKIISLYRFSTGGDGKGG